MSVTDPSLSLQNLHQLIDEQGQLTLEHTTFANPRLSRLLDIYYDGYPLVVREACILEPEPTDASQEKPSRLVITGTSSFLNIPNLPLTMTVQELPEGIDLFLRYQLPASWKFSQSFPNLPRTWQPLPSIGIVSELSQSSSCSLLDTLILTNASFLVATSPYQDETYGVQLNDGLNFAAHWSPTGILGAIEGMLQIPDSLTLAGPIIFPADVTASDAVVRFSWPPTRNMLPQAGINLKAETATDLSIGAMRLSRVFTRVCSPLYSDFAYPGYSPGLFVGGDLFIDEQFSLEITAERAIGMANELLFLGTFEGLELPSLSQMANLVGADDLASSLTSNTDLPNFLSGGTTPDLRSISLSLNMSSFEVNSAGFVIGLNGLIWHPVDESITVQDLAAHFHVTSPFSSQRSLQLALLGDLTIEEIPFRIAAAAPDFTISAQLPEAYTLSFQQLLARRFPDVPDIGNLTVNRLFVEIQPGQAYTLQAELADQPQPWNIELGPETLSLSNMQLLVKYTRGSGFSGNVHGILTLADIQLEIAYQFPGPLSLRGRLPALSMRSLITRMCGNVAELPDNFDIALTDSSVLIEKRPDGFILMLGSHVADYGNLALQICRVDGVWGFAVGIALNKQWSFAALSSALEPLSAMRFNNMVLVLSSLQSTAFTFPDMAVFNNPALASTKITLPGTTPGVIRGINCFAEMAPGSFQALDFLHRTLHLDKATLDVMLQIGIPPTNFTLSASLSGQIDKTTTFTGSLRMLLGTGGMMLSLLGDVGVVVQKKPLVFSGEMDITPQGAYFEGTMMGSWTDAFDVRGLVLSNLAFALGINLEGIPTLGLAGTLTLKGYQGAMAVLFDSVTPSKSLLAGSISDIRLEDISRIFLDESIKLPLELLTIVKEIALIGIPLFTCPPTLAQNLDTETLSPEVIQAFANAQWTLPSDPKQALLVAAKPGKLWYLTDHTTLRHYTIARQKDLLQVTLQVQLALVPQNTKIGKLNYPQGIRLAANARILNLDASVVVEVNTKNGIDLEGSIKPIDLGDVFRISGANGRSEPQISLATYDAPISRYRGPHCVISGAVTILGTSRELDLSITGDAISLLAMLKIFDLFQANITAKCPLSGFARANFFVEATMQNDFFDFLKNRGNAAIKQYAQAASAAIAQAQGKVDDAQQQVSKLNGQIATQIGIIQGERAKAQQGLTNAQRDVDSIQGAIDTNQRKIGQLQREIDQLGDEIKSKPWLAISNGAKITDKGAEIVGLEAAIVSEKASLETATGVLNACKKGVATFPIEADPRVAALYSSLKAANLVLQGANAFLAQTRDVNSRMATAAAWIAQHGGDNVVDIKQALFSGQLKILSGGSVSMGIDLNVLGRSYHLNQSVNFRDLDKTVESFVDQLKQLV